MDVACLRRIWNQFCQIFIPIQIQTAQESSNAMIQGHPSLRTRSCQSHLVNVQYHATNFSTFQRSKPTGNILGFSWTSSSVTTQPRQDKTKQEATVYLRVVEGCSKNSCCHDSICRNLPKDSISPLGAPRVIVAFLLLAGKTHSCSNQSGRTEMRTAVHQCNSLHTWQLSCWENTQQSSFK